MGRLGLEQPVRYERSRPGELVQTLYEATGTVTRNAFRMANGQLADWVRLITSTPARAILV